MLDEENKNPASYSLEDYRANLKKQIQILGAMLYADADELIDKCKSPLCFDDYKLKLEACLTKCGRPVLILQTLKPSYDICSSFSMSKWVEEVQEERKKRPMSKKKRKKQKKKQYDPDKNRPLWTGYYERKTKTKKEKQKSHEEKHNDYLKYDEE